MICNWWHVLKAASVFGEGRVAVFQTSSSFVHHFSFCSFLAFVAVVLFHFSSKLEAGLECYWFLERRVCNIYVCHNSLCWLCRYSSFVLYLDKNAVLLENFIALHVDPLYCYILLPMGPMKTIRTGLRSKVYFICKSQTFLEWEIAKSYIIRMHEQKFYPVFMIE